VLVVRGGCCSRPTCPPGPSLPTLQADVIHIDAAHEYDDVKEDIRLWWPLVRPCGVLLGDDYTHYWPGVVQAVDEFANEKQVAVNVAGKDTGYDKWWVRKGSGDPSKPCL
jgi:predicted O-methyltransferase YrrM